MKEAMEGVVDKKREFLAHLKENFLVDINSGVMAQKKQYEPVLNLLLQAKNELGGEIIFVDNYDKLVEIAKKAVENGETKESYRDSIPSDEESGRYKTIYATGVTITPGTLDANAFYSLGGKVMQFAQLGENSGFKITLDEVIDALK